METGRTCIWRIFPCIIVAKERQLDITSRSTQDINGHVYRYSGLSGGRREFLEQCVIMKQRRNGIDECSLFWQPTPAFPSSMMMGFLLTMLVVRSPDYSELSDAQWFDVTTCQMWRQWGTIARQLIEKTVDDALKQAQLNKHRSTKLPTVVFGLMGGQKLENPSTSGGVSKRCQREMLSSDYSGVIVVIFASEQIFNMPPLIGCKLSIDLKVNNLI